MKIILICIYFCLLAACTEKNHETTLFNTNILNATPFLSKTDTPEITFNEINDLYFSLKVKSKEKIILIKLDNSPGEGNILIENFFANFCEKEVFVIVLQNFNSKGDSYGSFYNNIIINPENGNLIKVLEGGEFKDKETNKIVSDDQKNIISMLKSNSFITQKCTK